MVPFPSTSPHPHIAILALILSTFHKNNRAAFGTYNVKYGDLSQLICLYFKKFNFCNMQVHKYIIKQNLSISTIFIAVKSQVLRQLSNHLKFIYLVPKYSAYVLQ